MKSSKYLLNKNFLLLCLINFALNMGKFMTNTLVPRYANALGAGAQLVGFISSSFAVTSLITKPISAPAIDSFKKKGVLTFGISLAVAAFIGYSFSQNTVMLIIFSMLHGVSMGITVTTCLTMVSDTVPDEHLASCVAYYSVLQAMSTAIGPSIGISLSDKIGYKYTFAIGACCQLAAIIMLLFYRQPEKSEKKPFKISLDNSIAKEALIPASTMLFLSATYATISSYLVIFAEGIGVSGISSFFMIYAIALLVCRPLVAFFTGKLGAGKLVPVTICFFAIGMITVSMSKSLAGFITAAVFIALGYGSFLQITQAICIMCAPPEKRGAATSTSYYGTDLGYLISPIVFGYVAENFGYEVMFMSAIVNLVIAMIIYFLNRSRFINV